MRNEFEIEATPQGRLDVKFEGRAVAYDRDDMAEALAAVRRHVTTGRAPSDSVVTFVHADGYRERIRMR